MLQFTVNRIMKLPLSRPIITIITGPRIKGTALGIEIQNIFISSQFFHLHSREQEENTRKVTVNKSETRLHLKIAFNSCRTTMFVFNYTLRTHTRLYRMSFFTCLFWFDIHFFSNKRQIYS